MMKLSFARSRLSLIVLIALIFNPAAWLALPGSDNNVQWFGLRHDSRDLLYRTLGGALPAGAPVTLRIRTFHNDVTSVSLRLYSMNASAQNILPMTLAAVDVSCYETGLEGFSCDFWQITLPNRSADNLWYRFILTDGSDTDYYADNTPALDGGLGAASDEVVDQSYALMVYDPAFSAPGWAREAIIYQIFPDRFRNGRMDNDAQTGDPRYDDPALALPWSTLPEGYCQNYAGGDTQCPWRFDDTPPDSSPNKEVSRGRDYFGGDLKGVDQNLETLQSLGVTAIYFNPIFDAGSNHSYDTQDYYRIDPYFGTQEDWENLVEHANQRGIRILLDGVFNHLSSDSPFFDRYQHYNTVGACESVHSPFRSWFVFHDVVPGTGPCVGSSGQPGSADYASWSGFDSIPILDKSNSEVQNYFLYSPNSVSRYWLEQGTAGWRLDVMGDASFPDGYWESFREGVKATKPDALIIGELWQKDSTLLRYLRGDRADTAMNYRLRDAVIGLLAPQNFDPKGFADSGRPLKPSEFAARLLSIQEDYPQAAYYSLVNLLDSHDTERLLWTLTPGGETRVEKELDSAHLAEGKQRLRLASLIQFTVPGAPTVYYGDEVGVTGDDDPDDRRTYPWSDLGGAPDGALFGHYQALSSLRRQFPALVDGDLKLLAADDATGVVAYGRKVGDQAAVVVVNRSGLSRAISIPVSGYLPDGLELDLAYAAGGSAQGPVTVEEGEISTTIGPLSGVVLASSETDLQPPAAPTGLAVEGASNGQARLAWDGVSEAAGYNLYRSPLSGGGWVKVNPSPLAGTNFTDTGLDSERTVYYAVTALDALGNESSTSNEVSALPQVAAGWAHRQHLPIIIHTSP